MQKSGNRVRIMFLLSRVGDGSEPLVETLRPRAARHLRTAGRRRTTGDRRAEGRARWPISTYHCSTSGRKTPERTRSFFWDCTRRADGTRETLEAAVAHFNEAIALDPAYARVYWWLYFCYWRLIGAGLPRAEMERKGEDALNKARAAGFVPPVPWIKARRDLIPASRPDQRTLALEAAAENPRSRSGVAVVRVHPVRRVPDRGGLQSRRVRLLRILPVTHESRSQRHVDSGHVTGRCSHSWAGSTKRSN